jgi:carbonic anhydrase/acetyltransferase-like protein (isoleucine patch superfamily)
MIRSYQGITPVIPTSCYIDPSAQVIGDVTLGEQASIWMNAVVRGDVNSIRIGAKSNVQDCAVLHGMRYLYPVIVGEMVTIGHNATVHGCVLEDAVLVGIGATILNNARIGEGSIIAAGFHRTHWSPAFPARSDARLATKTGHSSSSTPAITWTTRPFTYGKLPAHESCLFSLHCW